MERGDLAAVLIGIVCVVVVTALFSPPASPSPQVPVVAVPTTVSITPFVPVARIPSATPSAAPTTPAPVLQRIEYTTDYSRLPVRFIPSDLGQYGYSDAPWKYSTAVPFAYVEDTHGGITGTFTVPYPVWRMTSTLTATRTPENARFRMVLVDRTTGQILDGAEIRFPGSVTRTAVAINRPLYMVIAVENADSFRITLETPSEYA